MFELLRARDWWQYKIAPTVALFVGTALIDRNALLPLWPRAMLLVAGLSVCAAYVSVINDLTDRDDDAAAGKPNRQLAYSRSTVLAVLAFTIVAGAAIAWSWRGERLLMASYAASWLVFSLYSFQPFRLKAHGLAGVICDAAGAHLFPALTAILAASNGRGTDRVWLAAASVWAFAYGLRGILWHQLLDSRGDARSHVETFAVRHRAGAVRLGAFVAFPAEIIALAVLLVRIGKPLPFVALVYYAVVLANRARTALTLIVVEPKPHCTSVLQEYYDVYLPLALLFCATENDWRAVVVLAAYVALFAKGVERLLWDFASIALTIRDLARVPRTRTPL